MNEECQSFICDHEIRAHKLCLAINNIMMSINFSHDVEEIFHKVMEESCKVLGCESARIAMREGDIWVIRYVSNLPDNHVGQSFTDEELPHAALAMTTRKPVAIDDAFIDDRTNTGMMESLGFKSILVLPLLERNIVTGTLLFGYHSRAESFTDIEKDYAERLCAAVGLALLNASLYQDLAESKRLDEALNEIETILYSMKDCEVIMNKMLQLSTDVIGAESAVIFSKEGDRWLIRYVYKLSESLIGQSFSNTEVIHNAITAEIKRSLVVHDVENSPEIDQKFVERLGIRSLLDFPLILQGEVIGDLTFHYHSGPVSFTAKQVDFARKLQISISLALENNQRKRSENQLLELDSFKQGIIDSLPANIAVLDQQGLIIAVNRSWVLFAEENGLPDSSSVCVGTDYLAACRKAADLSDPLALEALLGIEMVLNQKITHFTLNYPCHSPTAQRWFMMQVVRSNEMQGAVVTHLDITDRIKVENKLQDANQELEAFNYSVAHDLRTPLNTLALAFQGIEILCGDDLNAQCKELVQNAFNSTLHMNQLLDALLTFSRMGHVEPQRIQVDLRALAHEIVTTLQQNEPERHVDVRISDAIEAEGDASLLRVVLTNLLGNAWKFAVRQENAVIEFGVEEIDGVATYFVRDNGVGFEKADANKLFIPFQRLPGAEISQGFGIGLATVERIIRRHGGRIWAEGEKGNGACFYFTLTAAGHTG